MIIEVLDPRGRVQQRVRIPDRGLRIGRGHDNDLVLDDHYVDAHHLELGPGPGGELRFVDRGSANGTWVPGNTHRVASGRLTPGSVIRIGRTGLRVVDPAAPVPPARVDNRHANFAGRLTGRPFTAVRFVGVATIVFALDSYLQSTESTTLSAVAAPAVGILLLGALWAGIWSLLTRLATHQLRFLQHLGWVSLVSIASMVIDQAGSWLGFLWPAAAGPQVFVAAGQFGLGVALLGGHLGLATEWPSPRRWLTAFGIGAAGLLIGVLISDTIDPGSNPAGPYATTLKPISGRLVPATTPDRFFESVESLRDEADAALQSEDDAQR